MFALSSIKLGAAFALQVASRENAELFHTGTTLRSHSHGLHVAVVIADLVSCSKCLQETPECVCAPCDALLFEYQSGSCQGRGGVLAPEHVVYRQRGDLEE